MDSSSLPPGLVKDIANPTPAFAGKTIIGLVLSGVGMYYLAIGKKEGDAQKMVIGAALLIGSMFIF